MVPITGSVIHVTLDITMLLNTATLVLMLAVLIVLDTVSDNANPALPTAIMTVTQKPVLLVTLESTHQQAQPLQINALTVKILIVLLVLELEQVFAQHAILAISLATESAQLVQILAVILAAKLEQENAMPAMLVFT